MDVSRRAFHRGRLRLIPATSPVVARYLLGLLHSRSPSFFTLHRPYSFATIATPHLGIPKYTGSLLSGVFHSLGSRLLSRTGEQLYVVDKEEGGRALLEVMADPGGWCSERWGVAS